MNKFHLKYKPVAGGSVVNVLRTHTRAHAYSGRLRNSVTCSSVRTYRRVAENLSVVENSILLRLQTAFILGTLTSSFVYERGKMTILLSAKCSLLTSYEIEDALITHVCEWLSARLLV